MIFMKTFAAILTCFTLYVSTAGAGIIYQQLPNAGASGYLSSTTTPGGSNLEELVWDSFSTATTTTLREIQWRGVRTNAPVDFQISINTIALSGGTVWHTNDSASETPTGTPGVYDYKFTLPAGFVITSGQTYWLQIVGLQSGWPEWHWGSGSGGNGIHTAQVPAITGNYRYINAAGDTAFTLLDQATVPVTVTLAKSPAAGGSVTGGGTFAAGANVTISATAVSGRTFLNWTEAGVVVSSSASYSFAADGNKTLTANFSGPNTGPFMISTFANPGIYGNVGGAGSVNLGEIRDLDVSTADGPSFVGWTEDGETVDFPYVNGSYQVTATADRHLTANFAYTYLTSYVYSVASPPSGGYTMISGTPGLSGGSYSGGTMITFNATPAVGYHFAYWKQGTGIGDLSGLPRIVGTNPSLNHVVCYGTVLTAYFEPNNTVLSLNASPAGGGTIYGEGTFGPGTDVTVSAEPAIGYVFVNWTDGGNIVSTSANYDFTLNDSTTLTANFVAQEWNITGAADPVAGGSVSGGGIYCNGDSATLTASAAPGYTFSNWTLGGYSAGIGNPLTIPALGDFDFVAHFTPLPVITIAPSVSGGGFNFSWPSGLSGWTLEESPDLSPGSWVPSAETITPNAGRNQITIPAPTGRRFFRLTHP